VDASTLTSSGRIVKKASAAISDVSTLGVGARVIRRASAATIAASQVAVLDSLLTKRAHAAIESVSMVTAQGLVRFSVSFVETTATFVPTLPKSDISPLLRESDTTHIKTANSYSTYAASSRRAS
jgi:hypothetical protein